MVVRHIKINRLNEERDKNGKLICYGAKSGSSYTVVFGAYKNGRYSVSLLANSGVRGGSQVCFKTIEEFEEFSSNYEYDVDLVTRRLDPSEENLVEVPTDYGNLWMKPEWYNRNPSVDKRQLNKVTQGIIDVALDNINGKYDYKSVEQGYSYTEYKTKEKFRHLCEELEAEIYTQYNIDSHAYFEFLPRTIEISLLKVDEATALEIGKYIEDMYNCEVTVQEPPYNKWIYPYQISIPLPKVDVLVDKIRDKCTNKINNMQPLTDDVNLWNIAKNRILQVL